MKSFGVAETAQAIPTSTNNCSQLLDRNYALQLHDWLIVSLERRRRIREPAAENGTELGPSQATCPYNYLLSIFSLTPILLTNTRS